MAEIVLKRKLFGCCALATALLAPPAALAVTTANSGVVASAAGARVVSHGSVSGTIGAVNGASFTLQTPGRRTGVVTALIAAANRILNEDTPYVYGGGHTSAGNASIGIPGPGYNGRRIGFDCSGAVGAVLVGAGLWTPGSGVPRDDGIITQLRSEGLIAPGVGKGPVEVTLWDRPTVHIFMNIDGRFFGTSDGADGGDANGGAGWLYDGAPDTLKPAFKPYHLLRSALRGSTSSGQSFGFLLSAAQWKIGGLVTGEKVHVRYKELASGAMVATAVSYPGSVTATGTVASLGPRAGSFTIQTPDGPALTLSTVSPSPLLGGVVPGDTVRVTYSKVRTELIAHAVKVTATPATSTGTSAGGTGAGGMSLGPSG